MSQNIKKIDIKDLLKKFTLNNTNSYSTEKGEVNKTNSHIENINIDSPQFEADGLIKENIDQVLPKSVQDELDEIGITPDELGEMIHFDSITIDDIESITDCGSNGENKKIVINLVGRYYGGYEEEFDKVEVFLTKENGEYIVSSIKFSDGTTIQCNLSESRKQKIRDSIGLSEDVEIKGYSVLGIKGQRVPVYWNVDSLRGFKSFLDGVKEALNLYPSSALNRVLDSGHFKGIFYGTHRDAPDGMDKDENWAAFALKDEYIYYNAGAGLEFSTHYITHEFAHLLDRAMGPNGVTSRFSVEDVKFKKIYEKYKKQFQQAFDDRIGYNSYSFPEGIPIVEEFFAEVVSIYLQYPEELESLFPDLYEYVDDIMHGREVKE